MSELMQILTGPLPIPTGLARSVEFGAPEDYEETQETYFCTQCAKWMHISMFSIRTDGRVMTHCKPCRNANFRAKMAQK